MPTPTPHPGEFLAEILAQREAQRMAEETGVPFADLLAVLEGDAPVTNDLAAIIGAYVGQSVEMWSELQDEYDKRG